MAVDDHHRGRLIGLLMVVLVLGLLWRKIDRIGNLTVALWCVMLVTVGLVMAASFTDFSASRAFDFPANAVDLGSSGFWVGVRPHPGHRVRVGLRGTPRRVARAL
jgi:hypothetical protein